MKNKAKSWINISISDATLFSLAQKSLIGYCLCFSLSIALTQLFLISFMIFVLSALIANGGLTNLRNKVSAFFNESVLKLENDFYVPLIAWLLIALAASIIGLDPLLSIRNLIKLSLYFLLPLCVYFFLQRPQRTRPHIKELESFILLLLIGQAIAAIHTVLSVYMAHEIKPKVPGPVTESGQILILFPLLFGVLYFRIKESTAHVKKNLLFTLFSILIPLLLFSWNRKFHFIPSQAAILFGIIGFSVVAFSIFSAYKNSKENHLSKLHSLIPIFAALIFAAFILNLKRGPWLAVALEVIAFGLIFSRKTMLWFLACMLLISLAPPVAERISSFAEHFFIGGGRFDMWKLGFQLLERFPLGIGFGNSNLMRQFDPTLPLLHRHMHNNILNVALETGLLGAITYIWWLVHFVSQGFKKVRLTGARFVQMRMESVYAILILISIIGWQVAGIVEYNFGDSEIRLLVLVFIGFFFSCAREGETIGN